jgi:hypothetical protein
MALSWLPRFPFACISRHRVFHTFILWRVWSSVITNNGLWIRWLDLLTASFAITRNHNQLQELAINLQPNPSSLTAEISLHSLSLSTAHSNWSTLTLISFRHGPHTENIALLLLRACLFGFPYDRYPARSFARWLLPSNCLGANHIENTTPVLLAACSFERVYLAKGVSGSIAQCFEQIRLNMFIV